MQTGRANNEKYRASFKDFAEKKAEMSATIASLEAKLATAVAERDSLKEGTATATATTSTEIAQMNQQLDALRAEKTALEKALQDEKAARAAASSTQSPEQETIVVRLIDFNELVIVSSFLSGCSKRRTRSPLVRKGNLGYL